MLSYVTVLSSVVSVLARAGGNIADEIDLVPEACADDPQLCGLASEPDDKEPTLLIQRRPTQPNDIDMKENVFHNPVGRETAITVKQTDFLDRNVCQVYGEGKPWHRIKTERQSYLTIARNGTGVGVLGPNCDVAMIEDWAKWMNPAGNCLDGQKGNHWLMFWQGTTSVAADGYSIISVKLKMKVPKPPKTKARTAYSAWTFGMQPQLQPDLDKKNTFCDLEGGKESLDYNSGQFAKLMFRSANNTMFGGQFNMADDSWHNRFIMASNIMLGKSAAGTTSGYGVYVQPGDWINSHMQLGDRIQEMRSEGKMGWQHSLGIDGTDIKTTFMVNSSVYESIFFDQAVNLGVLDADDDQGKLVKQNRWSWAVGPVYEFQLVGSQEDKTKAPNLEDIPTMWPEDTLVYEDVVLEHEKGGDWAHTGLNYVTIPCADNVNKKCTKPMNETDGDYPWILKFNLGMELTGNIFDNKLFTDYNELQDYVEKHVTVENHPEDYKQVQCVYKCIMSRFHGSFCNQTKCQPKTFYCEVKFDAEFPPKECDPGCWNGNTFTCGSS